MKQVNLTLRLEKHGHDVIRTGVTPAEAAILVSEHHVNAGGNPLHDVVDQKDITRSDVEEVDRLRAKFGLAKVNALFPGAKPALPVDMKEAVEMGLRTPMPGTKLLVKHQ